MGETYQPFADADYFVHTDFLCGNLYAAGCFGGGTFLENKPVIIRKCRKNVSGGTFL